MRDHDGVAGAGQRGAPPVRPRRGGRGVRCRALAAALLFLTAAGLTAAPLADQADPRRCQAAPNGAVTVEGPAVRFTVRSPNPGGSVQWMFKQPLITAGRERLVLDGRGEEPTLEGVLVARVMALDAKGAVVATYEPDILFPPEWNLRELLFSEFDRPLPAQIAGLAMHLWLPNQLGQPCHLRLRRAEVIAREQVRAELQPTETPRPALPVQRVEPADADRRWTNLGPGGGGWYRVMAISPHDGACYVGGDVGGVYRSRDHGRTWQILNEGLTNTYVNAFAFHPREPGVLLAGTDGGVARSTDGGEHWTMVRAGFPPLRTFGQSAPVSAVAFDPSDPRRALAGVGHERDFGRLGAETTGGRIYLSDDSGQTWQPVTLPGAERRSVFGFLWHPRERQAVFASTPGGLFRSADRGASWTRWGTGLDGYQTTFAALCADQPETMLLGFSRGPDQRGGALKSTDGGRTWRPALNGLPQTAEAWRLIAHPTEPRTFYLGWYRQGGLHVTRDAGESWQPVNLSRNIRSAWFFIGTDATGLAIDPRDPARLVYCNDMDLYQTLDAGATWDQMCCDLATPPTADRPAVWRGRGAEILCLTGPQAIAVDPSRPSTLYFGYWDTCAWKSDDGGRTGYRLTNGIHSGYGRMGCVLLDPADPDTVWLTIGQNYTAQRLYLSVNGGRQFRLVGYPATGLPAGGIFTLAVDPTSARGRRVLYAGVQSDGIFKSLDGGFTWQAANQGLPADSRHITQLAVDPRRPQTVWAVAGAHYHADTRKRVAGYIARSDDGGGTWRILKDRIEPQCLAIDPFDSRRVAVGNRNFSGLGYPQAVYVTRDGGATWQDVPQDAFAAGPGSRAGDQGWRCYLTSLAADASQAGVLYAGQSDHGYDVDNGRGVYVSRDFGLTWTPFSRDGLHCLRVGTLVADPVNPARLYVGTGGNGLFRWGAEGR